LKQLQLAADLKKLVTQWDLPEDADIGKAGSDYINMLHRRHGYVDAAGKPIKADVKQLKRARKLGNLADPMHIHQQAGRRELMTKPDHW
jgi:hypothetical protein